MDKTKTIQLKSNIMKTVANLFLVSMLIISIGKLRAESSNGVDDMTAGEIFNEIETPYNKELNLLMQTLDLCDEKSHGNHSEIPAGKSSCPPN